MLSLVGKFKDHINSLATDNPREFQEMNRTLQYSFESWPLKLESLEKFINEASTIIDNSMKGNKILNKIFRIIIFHDSFD